MSRRIINYTTCCGVKELAPIQNVALSTVFKNILADYEDNGSPVRCAYYIFTHNTGDEGDGFRLKAFIEENGLGDVHELPSRKNPNTGRKLKRFAWASVEKTFLKIAPKLVKKIEAEEIERLNEKIAPFKIGDTVRMKDGCKSVDKETGRAYDFKGTKKIMSSNPNRFIVDDLIHLGDWWFPIKYLDRLERVGVEKKIRKPRLLVNIA